MTACTIASFLIHYMDLFTRLTWTSLVPRPHSQVLGRKNHMQALLTHSVNHRPQRLLVWQNSHEGFVCILALWKLCGCCGIVCGLPVDSQWPVNTRLGMGVLEAQDGDVLGVDRLLPFGLSSGPIRILNEHFQL